MRVCAQRRQLLGHAERLGMDSTGSFEVIGDPGGSHAWFDGTVAIFTPDDEPYLGRESVYRFDTIIQLFVEEPSPHRWSDAADAALAATRGSCRVGTLG
jgi:hypothetical protein